MTSDADNTAVLVVSSLLPEKISTKKQIRQKIILKFGNTSLNWPNDIAILVLIYRGLNKPLEYQ